MEYGQLYHVYLNSTFLRQILYKYLANNSLTPLTFPVLRKVPLFPRPAAPGNIRTAAVCSWRRRRGYICLMKSRRSHRFVWEARWLALWFTCALTQRECVCVGVRERRRELEESGRSQRRQWQCLCCCAPFRGRLALSFLFSFADVFKLKRDKQTIKINLRA